MIEDYINHLKNVDSADKAFVLFRQILFGHTFDIDNNFYIKHSNIDENSRMIESSMKYAKIAEKNGLLKNEVKLNVLFENGSWTREQEENYQARVKRIDDLRVSKKKLVIPSQIKAAEEILSNEIQNLYSYFEERESIMGLTVENFCLKKNQEFILKNYFYKDEKLTQPAFDEEDFENMDAGKLYELSNYYYSFLDIFSENNLKKITVCPMVFNILFLSESVIDFYGKPIRDLTTNQTLIYSNYKYYKNISSSPDYKQVPQEYYSDLQKIVNHYDQQYSILYSKAKSKK